MRMALNASLPVEKGNALIQAGTMGQLIERIVGELKPEAAYFFLDDQGRRSAFIVFDMQEASQLPAVVEPWFLAYGAEVSVRPVMNAQDLASAGATLATAGQKYGPRPGA